MVSLVEATVDMSCLLLCSRLTPALQIPEINTTLNHGEFLGTTCTFVMRSGDLDRLFNVYPTDDIWQRIAVADGPHC
jgi:hypothetical protein